MGFKLHFVALFSGSLLMLGYAPVAGAQTASDKETARSLMKQGDQALAAADYSSALKAYEAAHDIMRVPTTGLALGRAQEKAGQLVEARDTWLAVQRMPVNAGEPAIFSQAREQAARGAAALSPRIPSLTVRAAGLLEGVTPEVTINGSPLRASVLGLARKANPGDYAITAKAPGCRDVSRNEKLAEGENKVVELAFADCRPVAAPASADGADAKKTISTTELQRDRAMQQPSRVLMWVGFGVAGAGVLAGSITGMMSLGKASSAKDVCNGQRCPPSAQGDIDDSKSLANISNIAFGVGAVGLGVGFWQLVAQPKAESGRRGGASVTALLRPNGVAVTGRF